MITRAIAVGASYFNCDRWSRYQAQPDVDQNSAMFRRAICEGHGR